MQKWFVLRQYMYLNQLNIDLFPNDMSELKL